jgi:hypothetical protein
MNTRREPTDRFDAQLRQALRESPHAEPPADFARGVVAAARHRASRTERWLLLAPGVAFVPAALYVSARYGGQWVASFASLLPAHGIAGAANWLAATAACLALTWVFSTRADPQRG